MGRGEAENERVLALAEPGDIILRLVDRPGPTALLRNLKQETDLSVAAGLVARYGKKGPDGRPLPGEVACQGPTGTVVILGEPGAGAPSPG